jgi:hypothetical protein
MLGAAEGADQLDDIEAEFVPGQDEAPFLLGAEAGPKSEAFGVTAADLEPQADGAL